MENYKEKQLSTKRIFTGKIMNVNLDEVEIADGKKSTREYIEHSGGVVIAAKRNDGKILLVSQYRYAIRQMIYELPAGKLEKYEDPFLAAKRELEEETGYIASKWEDLGYIQTSPGILNEKLYLYKASELSYKGQKLDDGEFLNCFALEETEILEKIKSGEINDAKTICGIMRAFIL